MRAMKIYAPIPAGNFITSDFNLVNGKNAEPCAVKSTPFGGKEDFKLLNYASVGTIVPFCAKKKTKADDAKHETRKLCAACHYGKADILDDLDKLKFKKKDGKLFLEGYCTQNGGKMMTGVCEELAHKVGTILGERLKDDYTPIVLSFSGTKYDFSEHVCVVLIKRSEKNDAQMEGIRNLKYDENLNDIEGYDGEALFNGAIFVDPSLGVVCDLEKLPPSYKSIVSFNTIEKNNPYNGPKEINPGSNNFLGYIKDICPELLKAGAPPKGMVSFILPKQKEGKPASDGRLKFRIYLPEEKRYIIGKTKDLEETLPNSKLTALMVRLEEELERAEGQDR